MNKEEKNSNKCPICVRPTHKESKYCIFHASAEEKTKEEFKEALKGYVDKIKKEDGDYNFEKFIFIGDIKFQKRFKVNVLKNADFNEAIFEEHAGFKGLTFEGDAFFNGVIFKAYAVFNGATFKGDTHFDGAIFEEYAGFKGLTFEGDTHFDGAIFEEYAGFNGATFEGVAHFDGVTFNRDTGFDGVTFKGDTGFDGVTFEEDTFFNGLIFKGDACFDGATFKGKVGFKGATFKGDTFFNGVIFKEYTDFDGVTFEGDAGFDGATFEGDVLFKLNNMISVVILSGIKVFTGKKCLINVNNGKGKISFERANLENTYLDIELVEGIFIDFTGALLRNTTIEADQINNHIMQEKNKEFFQAKKIFLNLKNNFLSIGQYEDEVWAFKKEKDMERKSNCHFKTLHKWLWSCFLNGIFGYGIQPSKVIISAILIISLFAFLFTNPGISNVVGIEVITSNNFLDCIYFSTITFTTLGYGDFRPLEGWGRILAGSEAFIGAFMMALFVYTFARRTGGR